MHHWCECALKYEVEILENAEHKNSSHLELDATDEEAAQGEKKGCWVWVWVVGISWRATTLLLLYWGSTTNTNEECGGLMKMLWVCSKSSDISLSRLGRGLGLWMPVWYCGWWMPPRSSFVRISLHPESRQHHTMQCWLRAIATNIAWENICSYQHRPNIGLKTT